LGPDGVAVDRCGDLYIADYDNNQIDYLPACTPPVPLVGADSICIGQSFVLDTAFLSSNTTVATVTSNTVTAIAWGFTTISYKICGITATINLSVKQTCPPAADVKNVVNPVVTSLEVYPNPTEGSFTLQLLSPKDEHAQASITNIVGQEVMALPIVTNKQFQVNIRQNSALPPGIYFIKVVTADGRYEAKITVE
jgi:hypothetical protein